MMMGNKCETGIFFLMLIVCVSRTAFEVLTFIPFGHHQLLIVVFFSGFPALKN